MTSDATSLTFETGDIGFLGNYTIQVTVDNLASSSPSLVQASFTLKVWTFCDNWQLEFDASYTPGASLTYVVNTAAESISFDLNEIKTKDTYDGCKLVN